MDVDEIMPTLPLHKFIAIVKTEQQVDQLRRAILSGNYDVNELDEKGFSSLHWAVLFENVPVVELLTQLQVDPLVRDLHYSYTSLDYAVGQYANSTIARIITKSYPTEKITSLIRSQNNDGETCLHIAVKFGDYSCIFLLIQRAALASLKNNDGKTAMDFYDEENHDNRIRSILEKAVTKENLSKCWNCGALSHFGTKRCSRCHYARYCNRKCQVAHWKDHKKDCEPVVLARANGHFISKLFGHDTENHDLNDYIISQMHHKNGTVKSIATSSIKDIYEESRNVHRAFQNPGDSRTEFTVLVQMPKHIENGPLLVKNVKRTFTAFVSPDEQGYQLLCSKIEKNSTGRNRYAYFKCEFDSAFPGTAKIFASTCASSF